MKRRIRLTLFFVLSWSVTSAAGFLPVSAEEQGLLGIEVQPVVAVASGRIGEITLRAGFAPDAEWAIKTPFSGILHQLFVQVGDRVSAGDPLMTVRSAEVIALQRDYLQAGSELTLQKTAYERDRKLREAGSVSSRRWQETQFAYDMARAEYAGLRAQLQLAGFSDEDLESLSRNMQVTPDMVLRAPADALVVERPALLGDHLDGAELLARLGDPARLNLVGMLSKAAAAHLYEGAQIRQEQTGSEAQLVHVSPVIDPQTQTVYVRAEPRLDAGLRPGQLTRWSVLSDGELMTVPSAAIVKLDGEDVVYVLVTGGFEPRQVTVKNTGAGDWIVLDGLRNGDRVAISGTAVLKGMSIGMGGGDG